MHYVYVVMPLCVGAVTAPPVSTSTAETEAPSQSQVGAGLETSGAVTVAGAVARRTYIAGRSYWNLEGRPQKSAA